MPISEDARKDWMSRRSRRDCSRPLSLRRFCITACIYVGERKREREGGEKRARVVCVCMCVCVCECYCIGTHI